jgi:predicted PurR-regulated permease PerM
MSTTETKDARYFLVTLLLIFLVLTGLLLLGFITPLVLGIVLSGLSFGWFKKIRSALGGKKNLAALLTLLVVITIIILPLTLIAGTLFVQAFDLFTATQEKLTLLQYPQVDAIKAWLGQYGIDFEGTLEQFVPSLKSLSLYISRQIGNIFSNVVNFLVGFFIMIMTIFYFLRDGEKIGKFLIDISPLGTEHEIHLYKAFRKVGGAIFVGNFVSGIIQGLLGGIGFAIFGIGSPVLWGVIMAFLALIPLLGPYLIFIPATAYLFITGTFPATIAFLLYNIIVVSGVDNLIKPKLIGDKINVHPLLILLSILGGLKFFGIMGIIYGPLIVAILLTLLHIYKKIEDEEAQPELDR